VLKEVVFLEKSQVRNLVESTVDNLFRYLLSLLPGSSSNRRSRRGTGSFLALNLARFTIEETETFEDETLLIQTLIECLKRDCNLLITLIVLAL